ncbi:hypothetical protein [Spirosoma montaniterrae]|uniref:DUF5683 domain-containing protein n=1 Tax=Spirosoma montaniterrae TaxID=1178516 RepID=A0A1P9WYW0_9BACT|nr:hypothetical protein [Spirosoma montaniterrae]AQG80544.1 hypothetical protein AWR27_15160 [Spirosoma montaniterrae]
MKHLLFLCSCLLPAFAFAQTTATNVRLRAEPTVRKVIVEYELPQMLASDSIYLELETASGRIIRPISVNGDVGKAIKPGKNKLIAWDVVRDNVRVDEDVKVLLRVARVVTVASPATIAATKTTAPATPAVQAPVSVTSVAATTPKPTTDRIAEPGVVSRRSPVIPIVGWTLTAGAAAYATILFMKANRDTEEYNAAPKVVPRDKLVYYKDLSDQIDKNRQMATIAAGAAGVFAVATVAYMVFHKPKKPARTSFVVQPGRQVATVGIIHRF